MKFIYLLLLAAVFAGCNSNAIEISGTATNLNGNTVSILNSSMNVMAVTVIEKGKFTFDPFALKEPYYLTFSVQAGQYPRLYEIYLEPGKYTVNIPTKETDYLDIKTDSKIQNNLSAYYNYENSVLDKFRNELARWDAKSRDPKDKTVLDSGLMYVVERQEAARKKVDGAQIFAMSSFVEKYPNNESIPHIITNTYYKENPVPYYVIFQKLASSVKNSADGKKLGAELQQLVKQMEEKEQVEKQRAAAMPPPPPHKPGTMPLRRLGPNAKMIKPNSKEYEEFLKHRRAAVAAYKLRISEHRD